MNKTIFKTLLRPRIKENIPKNPKEAAELIADAYERANTLSFTMFGQKFSKSNHMDWFKFDLEQAFIQNAFIIDKPKTDADLKKEETGWKIMAKAFYNFWKDASFKDIPPPPGIVKAVQGVNVTFPGDREKLAKKLKMAFNQGTVDGFIDLLSNALIEFESTIAGKYSGLLANGNPVVLDWVGVFGGLLQIIDETDDSLKVNPFGGIGSNIKAIVDFEKRHEFDFFETGITVDLKGNINREFSDGMDDFVGYGIIPEILAGSIRGDLIFSHIHPPELESVIGWDDTYVKKIVNPASALSWPDFIAGIAMEAQEVRAVDLIYIHIIQPPRTGWKEFKKISGIPDIVTTNIPVFFNTNILLDIRETWEKEYEAARLRTASQGLKRFVKQYELDMTPEIYDFIHNKKYAGWIESSVIYGEATHAACVAVSKKFKIPYERVSKKLLSMK